MIYPLDPGIVRRFADGLGTLIVVEEKRDFLERSATKSASNAPSTGKQGLPSPSNLPITRTADPAPCKAARTCSEVSRSGPDADVIR
jgi:TPP-dependent indolepyruvate ferredoxin oxidoreductase alpha subunit